MTQFSERDAVRLQHMIDYAREAVALCRDKTRADLSVDRLLELALMQLVQTVGEAASRVSEVGRQHIELPWPVIVAMRHRLVHGYDTINLDTLWDVVQHDLPPLIAQLELILGGADGPTN